MSDSPSTGRSPPSTPPPLAEGILTAIETHLQQRETRRDDLYQRARRLRRLAQGTMIRLHEGTGAKAEVAEVRRAASELAEFVQRDARGDASVALDALQEAVEACLLGAVVQHTELPGPVELGVEPEPYLLGLGDLVGELRRLTLDQLVRDDLAGADATVGLMDRVVRVLMRFDTTRAIVALKPKQDVARSLLERTRGDVTMAHLLERHRSKAPPRDETPP
jgi:translin